MRHRGDTRREEGRRMEKLQGLMEEAKTRAIIYAIIIILLSVCLSLTSNTVWFNIPISILLISVLRYFSLEIEFQWRMTPIRQESYHSHLNIQSKSCNDPLLLSPPISKKWKRRIDSRLVAAAVDEFVVKIVREFITGLWYSSLTPDQEFPDQIRLLINDVLGEVAQRLKHINLIELLTRDVVDLIGSHIELYRRNQAYIGVDVMETLSSDERDERLKHYLASTKELHPALISSDNECKVLQQLMGGVVAIVLRSQDVQCPIVRSLARELLACAVMQPIMNFASPMFINELIEFFVLSAKDEVSNRKTDKGESEKVSKGKCTREQPQENYSKYVSDSGIDSMNPRNKVYLRNKYAAETDDWPQRGLSSSCNKLPNNWMEFVCDSRLRLGDFPELVEAKRQRRTQILAPDNLDNVWTKGWNYKLKESRKSLYSSGSLVKSLIPQQDSDGRVKRDKVGEANNSIYSGNIGMPSTMVTLDTEGDAKWTERGKQGSTCGIVQCSDQTQYRDLPITSRSPLDNTCEKQDESITHAIQRLKVQHRHSKSGGTESEQWQNFDRTYISEDKGNSLTKNKQRTSGSEIYGNFHDDNLSAAVRPQTGNIFVRKLDCWVLGVHFEKVGMKSIAVYSIAVTNSENKTWFVDRRYRNFEQLHRRLRNIPNYKLHLPPKSFISSNLDDFFLRQRCILLDKYLKDLLSIPNIAEQHEVWDFLSATSKNYSFGKITSVMETLAYNVDDAMVDLVRQFKGVSSGLRHTIVGTSSAKKQNYINVPWRSERGDMKNTNWDRMNRYCYLLDEEEHAGESGHNTQFLIQTGGWLSDSELHEEHFSSQLNANTAGNPATSILERSQQSDKGSERPGLDDYSTTESLSGSEMLEDEVRDPPEWTPPKLCVPLLNLIDKVFQLHQKGWLRRQVFWIGKQILQLLMEDAIDDWLLQQIQWLKREDVIASGIKQVQDVLVAEGIFTSEDDIQQQNESPRSCKLGDKDVDGKTIQITTNPPASFQNHLEAAQRASLVRDIIFGGAPAPLVSIIGRKQYDRCAKDLYFFLQSTVCVKQLAYSLLELLLITIFPELHNLVCDIRNHS